MDWTQRQGRIAAAVVLSAVSAILLLGLSSFGIWDPWELASADLARQMATGADASIERPALGIWLVARGFALFGVHEWSGRLPIALTGIATVALAYALVERFAGRRAGVWAALVTGTSTLFLFNARQMLGAAPAFAASAAVFLCAMGAVFRPAPLRASPHRQRLATGAWMAGLALSIALATLASGVLLGVAPPLLGVAAAVLARNVLAPPFTDRRRALAAIIVLTVALVAGLGAAHAIWADYAGFGYWTGGTPRGGDPPTWEVAIERLFHSFAPWSALLPLALARMLVGAPSSERHLSEERSGARVLSAHASGAERRAGWQVRIERRRPGGARAAFTMRHPEEHALRLAVVGWVAFGFLAQALFTARYGPATFLPLVGAAAAVALFVRDAERSTRPAWGAALVALLFTGLVIRDYRAYPSGPIEGLAAEGIEVPEVFNPARIWALLLGIFALLAMLGFAADRASDAYPRLRAELRWLGGLWREGGRARAKLGVAWLRLGAPIDLLREQARRGPSFIVWLSFLGLLLAGIVGFGLACLLAPDWLMADFGMTSLGLRVGSLLLALPPLLVVVVAICRLALFGFAKLGSYRMVPALVASFGVATYASLGYLPELSSHFSPREVYDTYNELAAQGEPLGEFRVGGRAAAYYATGEIQEVATQAALIEFLRQDRRVWAAFRADDLASVNREYRQRAGAHVFVADARSARMILATNRPIEGMHNQNYLADAVLDQPPRPQHPVSINYDNRVELLGIDLDLPHGTYVGPGEAFRITWYFRVIAPVPGSYQPFVHIDGPGQRINGDHEPVDGHYPVRLWEPGDIIVDRQELRVPANYTRGNLTIFMGFYSGEQRLEIVSGPKDEVNRGRAGTLPIR